MLFLVLMAILFFPLRTVSSMTEPDAQFRRPQEARTFARALIHPTPFGVVLRDGVFLHGTQGIGKTTFLREDLTPALEDEGALIVYADLQKRAAWRDPVKTLAKAIEATRQKAAENALLPPADVSSSVPSDSIGNALFEAIDRSGLAPVCRKQAGIKLQRGLLRSPRQALSRAGRGLRRLGCGVLCQGGFQECFRGFFGRSSMPSDTRRPRQGV